MQQEGDLQKLDLGLIAVYVYILLCLINVIAADRQARPTVRAKMEETAEVTPGFLFKTTERETESAAALFSLVPIIPCFIFSSSPV